MLLQHTGPELPTTLSLLSRILLTSLLTFPTGISVEESRSPASVIFSMTGRT